MKEFDRKVSQIATTRQLMRITTNNIQSVEEAKGPKQELAKQRYNLVKNQEVSINILISQKERYK